MCAFREHRRGHCIIATLCGSSQCAPQDVRQHTISMRIYHTYMPYTIYHTTYYFSCERCERSESIQKSRVRDFTQRQPGGEWCSCKFQSDGSHRSHACCSSSLITTKHERAREGAHIAARSARTHSLTLERAQRACVCCPICVCVCASDKHTHTRTHCSALTVHNLLPANPRAIRPRHADTCTRHAACDPGRADAHLVSLFPRNNQNNANR